MSTNIDNVMKLASAYNRAEKELDPLKKIDIGIKSLSEVTIENGFSQNDVEKAQHVIAKLTDTRARIAKVSGKS